MLKVWDIAQDAAFPIDCGLVGRLDIDTSGIMMFTNDQRLADAVRDPPEEGSPLRLSPYKAKTYELRILSSRPHEESDAASFDCDRFAEDF
jgi:23S rRNA-/tRNA-specific pseudouridylate synthase